MINVPLSLSPTPDRAQKSTGSGAGRSTGTQSLAFYVLTPNTHGTVDVVVRSSTNLSSFCAGRIRDPAGTGRASLRVDDGQTEHWVSVRSGWVHARGLVGIWPRSPRRGAPYTFVTTEQFRVTFDLESLRDLLVRKRLVDAGVVVVAPQVDFG